MPRIENKDGVAALNTVVVLQITQMFDDFGTGGIGVAEIGDLRGRDVEVSVEVGGHGIGISDSALEVGSGRGYVVVNADD